MRRKVTTARRLRPLSRERAESEVALPLSLEEQYRAMAADRDREREAIDWVESLAGETIKTTA